MSHGDDFKLPGSYSIYPIEREALEDITPSAVNVLWPHLRVLRYGLNGPIQFGNIGVRR